MKLASKKFKLAPRIGDSAEAFGIEDKFETCLNLAPLVRALNVCNNSQTWHEYLEEPNKNWWINREAVAGFEYYGYSPQMISKLRVSPLLPAFLHRRILSDAVLTPGVDGRSFRFLNDTTNLITKSNLYIQYRHITSGVLGSLRLHLFNNFNFWPSKLDNLPNAFRNSLAVMEDLQHVLYLTRKIQGFTHGDTPRERARKRKTITGPEVKIASLNASCHIMKDFLILIFNGESWLVPFALFLEVYNKVTEMSCLLLYLHVCSGSSFPQSHYEQSLDFLRWCAKVLVAPRTTNSSDDPITAKLFSENKGFLVMKTMEAIGVGFISRREDKESFQQENRLLLDTMWSSLHEENLTDTSDIMVSELYEILGLLETPQIADLIGVVKVFGHPTIDIVNGLKKLNDRVHRKLDIDKSALRRCLGILNRDLMLNFYKKRRVFPLIERNSASPTMLNIIDKNIDITKGTGSMIFSSILPEAWAKLRFKQNATFDRADRQFSLIKDKALSLTRSQAIKHFLLPLGSSPRTTPQDRRALLSFLLTPEFTEDFQTYLSEYMTGDDFDDSVLEYLVIKLTAKELELKDLGRYFGASPMPERLRRQVQERNVMDFLSNYVPEQLLTVNELDAIHKLTAFRKLTPAFPNHTIIHVSADFSAWNNNFRRETVDHTAGAVLDSWFGLPKFYRKTMLAFEKMYVYYHDSDYRIFWNGQAGGIEGLNQATWSLIFIAGLKESLEKIGYRYNMSVKGDDVRMSIIVPNADVETKGFLNIRRAILEELRDKCAKLGWQLNPNESFVSLSVVCTSKQYLVRDSWFPCAAKKILKCGAAANVVFPTLSDLISTIYSSAHSAASQSTVGLPCYMVATFVAVRVLAREMAELNPSKEQLLAMSLWPQVLGGPGSLPLQAFFVRGENDLLSCGLSLFREMDMSIIDSIVANGIDPRALRSCIRSILNQPLEIHPDTKQLLLDPYALPIQHPVRPATILKTSIMKALKTFCRHPDVQDLLSAEAQEFDEALSDNLTRIEPCCPKLIAAIWEGSPTYLIAELISKFMQSSTVVQFLVTQQQHKRFRGRLPPVLHEMLEAHKKQKLHWLLNSSSSYDGGSEVFGMTCTSWYDPKTCNTSVTHQIREFAWGRKIHALTYPSLVDQMKLWDPSDPTVAWLDTLTSAGHVVKIHVKHKEARSQVYTSSHHYSSEPSCKAWLGSKTDSRLKFTDWPDDVQTEAGQRLLKLLIILSAEVHLDDNCICLLKQMIMTLTKVPPESLLNLRPQGREGNFMHRVETHHYSTITMPNYRPNIANMVAINNNFCRVVQGSSIRRTINYAANHYFLVVLATWPLQSSARLNVDYPDRIHACYDFANAAAQLGRYELCEGCCAEANDVPLTLRRRVPLPIYDLIHIPSIKCTPKEDSSLVNAVKVRLGQKLLNPFTVHELMSIMGCTPEAAIQTLVSRLSEYASGEYATLQQLGIHVPIEDEALLQLCSGFGLTKPPSHRINLDALAMRNPVELARSCVLELFGLYVEVIANTTPDIWSFTDNNLAVEYVKRVAPYTAKLQSQNLIHLIVGELNNNLTEHMHIRPSSFGAKQAETLTLHIFRAFNSNFTSWAQFVSRDDYTRMTIDGSSASNFLAKALMIARSAKLFIRYAIAKSRPNGEWRNWLDSIVSLTHEFASDYGEVAGAVTEVPNADIADDLTLWVHATTATWGSPRPTSEGLSSLMTDNQTIPIVSADRVIYNMELPERSEIAACKTDLMHLVSLWKPNHANPNLINQLAEFIIDLALDKLTAGAADEDSVLYHRLSLQCQRLHWYTTRLPVHASTETLELYLESHPDPVPEVDHDVIDVEKIVPIFRTASPTASRFTLTQLPTPDSSSPSVMLEFTTKINNLCQMLVEYSPPTRDEGMLSTCEANQYCLFHIIAFSRVNWPEDHQATSILSIGNSSGFVTWQLLKQHRSGHVIHLSIDSSETADGIYQAHSRKAHSIPPHLEGLAPNHPMKRRTTIFHGPDGDLTSTTAMKSNTLRTAVAVSPLRFVFLSLLEVPVELQISAISRVINLMIGTENRCAPLTIVWKLSLINISAVIRTLNLGTHSFVDVVGMNHGVVPCLSVTVSVINPKAIHAKVSALPLALLTSIESLLIRELDVGVGNSRKAAAIILDQLHNFIGSSLDSVLATYRPIPLGTETCLCNLPAYLGLELQEESTNDLNRLVQKWYEMKLPDDQLTSGLSSLKHLTVLYGASLTLRSFGHDSGISGWPDMVRRWYLRIANNSDHNLPSGVFPQSHPAQSLDLSPNKISIKFHQRHITIGVSGLTLDILHYICEGVARGFDFLVCRAAILRASVVDISDMREAVSEFLGNVTIHPCCRRLTYEALETSLNQSRINIFSWIKGLMEDQNIRSIADDPSRCDVITPTRSELSLSPMYDPHSPEYLLPDPSAAVDPVTIADNSP